MWFHVQLLHATRCNDCRHSNVQRVACKTTVAHETTALAAHGWALMLSILEMGQAV